MSPRVDNASTKQIVELYASSNGSQSLAQDAAHPWVSASDPSYVPSLGGWEKAGKKSGQPSSVTARGGGSPPGESSETTSNSKSNLKKTLLLAALGAVITGAAVYLGTKLSKDKSVTLPVAGDKKEKQQGPTENGREPEVHLESAPLGPPTAEQAQKEQADVALFEKTVNLHDTRVLQQTTGDTPECVLEKAQNFSNILDPDCRIATVKEIAQSNVSEAKALVATNLYEIGDEPTQRDLFKQFLQDTDPSVQLAAIGNYQAVTDYLTPLSEFQFDEPVLPLHDVVTNLISNPQTNMHPEVMFPVTMLANDDPLKTTAFSLWTSSNNPDMQQAVASNLQFIPPGTVRQKAMALVTQSNNPDLLLPAFYFASEETGDETFTKYSSDEMGQLWHAASAEAFKENRDVTSAMIQQARYLPIDDKQYERYLAMFNREDFKTVAHANPSDWKEDCCIEEHLNTGTP